jgi:ribosomal protein L7Ae-like RNA K-turn-binding protein
VYIRFKGTKKAEVITFSNKMSIGKAVGRDEKAVVALTDDGFAKAVKNLFEQ